MLGKYLRGLTTQHTVHDLLMVELFDRIGRHEHAISKDRNAVRKREYLRKFVGDVDHRDASRAEIFNVLQQTRSLDRVERRGGLVEENNARVPCEDLRDGDKLLVGSRDVSNLDLRPYPSLSQLQKRLPRSRGHLFCRGFDETHVIDSERDVLRDGQVLKEVEFLVYHPNSVLQRVSRRLQFQFVAEGADKSPLGWLMNAGDQLDQSGLSGAVLAHQGMYFAPSKFNINMSQSPERSERLANIMEVSARNSLDQQPHDLDGELFGGMLLDVGLVDDFNAGVGMWRRHLPLGIDLVQHQHGVVPLALGVLSDCGC